MSALLVAVINYLPQSKGTLDLRFPHCEATSKLVRIDPQHLEDVADLSL